MLVHKTFCCACVPLSIYTQYALEEDISLDDHIPEEYLVLNPISYRLHVKDISIPSTLVFEAQSLNHNNLLCTSIIPL